MSLLSRVGNAVLGAGTFGGLNGTVRATQMSLAQAAMAPDDPRGRYAVLRAYYEQNNLYDQLGRALYEAGLWHPATKPLRSPAFRIVEFYAAHLWPGGLPEALPIVTPALADPDADQATQDAAQAQAARLRAAIHQVWAWSNWDVGKQIMARWLPMLGDVFLKVATRSDAQGRVQRVYFQLIDPAHVADFDVDERGFLTWLRIEVPQQRRVSDRRQDYLHVEIWSKADQLYRRWEIDRHRGLNLSERALGPPTEAIPWAQMGIDFLPVVHAKFIDTGALRGLGAYLLQLDKIDAVNRDATRLAQMLFRHNQALGVVSGMGRDPSGRPLPPPQVADARTGQQGLTLADNELLSLPGDAKFDWLVANLHYEAHRAVNNDGLLDLQQDCPEMAYWRITEQTGGEITGRALRFMLGPAIKRLLEARGNAEAALARADAMALTIGAHAGLPGFQDLGAFEAGDFEHAFREREVIPISDIEQAQAEQLRADAAAKKLNAGWSQNQVFRDAGLSEADIRRITEEKATQDVIPTVDQ